MKAASVVAWSMGEKIRFTGRTEMRFGCEWAIAIYLTGHKRGQETVLPVARFREAQVEQGGAK